MSLKTYLQKLLNLFLNKKDTEFIAYQMGSADKSNAINIWTGRTTHSEYFTAPCSGYLCLYGTKNSHAVFVRSRSVNLIIPAKDWPQAHVFVSKGETGYFEFSPSGSQIDDASATFIPCNGART